jgi:hypothetical protein
MSIKSMMLPEEVNVEDNYNANPVSQEARVDSIYLLPNQSNNSSCRFVLQTGGILDMKNTKLILQAKPDNALNNNKAAYPMPTGVASLIDRAILRFGAKVACTSSNYGNYFSIVNSSFTSNDRKRNLDHYTYLTSNAWETGLDSTNVVYDGSVSSFGDTIDTIPLLNQDADSASNGSLSLADLFPGFINTDLALFLMRDEVSVELQFKAENSIGDRCIGLDAYDAASFANSIVEDELMLCCDHIYFSNLRMNQIRENFAANGFTAFYSDMQSTRDNLPVPAVATDEQRTTHHIGGAGKMISSILLAQPRVDASQDLVKYAMGKYGSDCCLTKKGFNVSINNQNIFAIDVANMNYAQLNNFLGTLYSNNYPEICYGLWNQLQPESMSDRQWATAGVSYQDFDGQQNYNGVNLGEIKVNSVPVSVELLRHTSSGGLSLQDFISFIMIKRQINIQPNGVVNLSYS